ncbi:hypothetical protein O3Q51_16255 [Cryomorphaceae bacterium 1068]|nr:hypothetical protein [Cryomorphaceae bacterium 1068]
MTDKLTFENWWADFSHKFRNDKDGGLDMLDRLKSEVWSFNAYKQEAFIDELLKRKNLLFFACELIPLFGNQRQIAEIKMRAKNLIERGRFEEILPEYLKVIIKNFEPADIQLLTTYYLNYQETLQFRIPSELFEIDQKLFLMAFDRYLRDYSVESLCEYDGLLYLTDNPNAIEFLISYLPLELSSKMKSFAKKKSKHSIVVRDKELSERLMKLGQ